MLLVVLVLIVLIALVAAAAYFAFQKSLKEENKGPTVYTSGVFSLVRQTPRDIIERRKLDPQAVREALAQAPADKVNGTAEEYLRQWEEILRQSVETVEKGDAVGVQTYCYEVPAKDAASCPAFTDDAYVTREQLQNYPELLPPFHLGCDAILKPKQAWDTSLNGAGWKPLLPVRGRYPVPDWRTVGSIQK